MKDEYVHQLTTETGLNVTEDLLQIIEEYNIPPYYLFGSFAIYTRRINMTRFLARYELYKMVQDLPGNIVECGVFQGDGLFAYAKFLEIFHPADRQRKVIGFDTFRGFSNIHENDGPVAEEVGPYVKQKFSGGYSSENFRDAFFKLVDAFHKDQFVPHCHRIVPIEGDINETIPQYTQGNPGARISMLILDVDLYKPTLTALEYLYPLVVPGGLIVLDEYAKDAWPGESRAFDEYFGEKRPKLKKFNWSSTPGAYFIKE